MFYSTVNVEYTALVFFNRICHTMSKVLNWNCQIRHTLCLFIAAKRDNISSALK